MITDRSKGMEILKKAIFGKLISAVLQIFVFAGIGCR
jgi:hypothetical protein